MIKPIKIAHCN